MNYTKREVLIHLLQRLKLKDNDEVTTLSSSPDATDMDTIYERLSFQSKIDVDTPFKKLINTHSPKQHIWDKSLMYKICACVVLAISITTFTLFVIDTNLQNESIDQLLTHNPAQTKNVAYLTSRNQRVELNNTSNNLLQEKGLKLTDDGTLAVKKSSSPIKSEQLTVEIPIGGEYKMILADGTNVWLNSDTKFYFPTHFTDSIRKVRVEGEAYFEVTKSNLPFIVETLHGHIQVLGTGFNVRSYADEVNTATTLSSGSVKYITLNNQDIKLQPGQQLQVSTNNYTLQEVNVALYTSWKDGKYLFENSSLESIMQQLSRWYNIKVIFKSEYAKKLHFTGDLERYSNVTDFFEFISMGSDVKITIDKNTVYIE
ncbi:MAG: FecR family protein [Marinifilaceae bacterium]